MEVPWHADAACYRLFYDHPDDDVFFAESKQEVVTKTARAKTWCDKCPVKDQCLTSALEYRDRFGVWGGLSWPQRKMLLDRIDGGELSIEDAVEEVCSGRR